jgi:hypothetical protein
MKLEKKLIACSILALIIGVSSVFPLAFLMSATAKAETGPEPWFGIDIPYAYWETLNGPLDYHPNMQFPGLVDLNETNSVSEQHMIMLNFTLTADTTKQPVDAQLEYYQIDVSLDNELFRTKHWAIGTYNNSSFNGSSLLTDFHFKRDEWFDTDTFDPMTDGGGGGLVRPNWSSGVSVLWPGGGSSTCSTTGPNDINSRSIYAIREAETVTISLYRIGWVTFSGNSTEVTLANKELIKEIQLEKYGEEGWLYNNLVPEDELATVDLLRPVPFEELNPPP